MIKGIIFDMDDTLVDSKPLHYRAWDKVLAEFGKKYSDLPEKFRGSVIGMRIIDMVPLVIDRLKIKMDAQSLYKKRNMIFLELVNRELKLFDGSAEALQLCKQLGLRVALASSGTREYVNTFVKKFECEDIFEVIISGDDVKRGKPDPEPYALAVKKLGLNPNDCVVVEDAHNGVISAKAAGCKCIGIPFRDGIKQDMSQADLVLDSMRQFNKDVLMNI